MVRVNPSFPMPANESERLRALFDLGVLDTAPEERFDRITRLASQLVGTPIVLVSLVDADRQWFKSRVGLDAVQTGRDVAFCAHTIMGEEMFVVEDASQDERFSENPLVTGQPNIRFYAGAPLCLTDGIRLGTLCAIDTQPRELAPHEEAALVDLSHIVIDELKLRQHIVELNSRRADLERANQNLERFADIAAQDLREPVRQLVAMSDIVESSEGPKQTRALNHLRASAVRAESLVSGYRHLSLLRLRERSDVAVHDIVSAAKNSASRNLMVSLDGDATLSCDQSLLLELFGHLFDNVAAHSSDHQVAVSCSDEGVEVVVRVSNRRRDTTPIDDSIFAPFHATTGDEAGGGIGLALVKRIVEMHDGEVAVEADAETFAVVLRFPRGLQLL